MRSAARPLLHFTVSEEKRHLLEYIGSYWLLHRQRRRSFVSDIGFREVLTKRNFMALSLQHIHLRSPNKVALANWYCAHLGFKIIDDLEKVGEPGGPVLITSDDGVTGLSIFTSLKDKKNVFPAFGADIETFLMMVKKFGKPRIYDHYYFFSFYIHDLDQNKIEICCTDYRDLKVRLDEVKWPYVFMTPATYTP